MAITLSTDDTRREAFLTAEQAKVQTGGGGTDDHRQLTHRSDPNQHPISAITGLQEALDEVGGAVKEINGKRGEEVTLLGTDVITFEGDDKSVGTRIMENQSVASAALGQAQAAQSSASAANARATTIEGKIPAQASATNQLADKDFVNSSIENVAAYYITKDAARNPFATKAELDAATVFYSGGQVRVPTRNDYAVVLADESKIEGGVAPTTRYQYDNGWSYQYVVNNTALTAAQWKAINSGITSEKVEEIEEKLPLSAGIDNPITGDLYMAVGSSKRIRRLGTPVSEYDAANKKYVDDSINAAIGNLPSALSALDAVIGGDEP